MKVSGSQKYQFFNSIVNWENLEGQPKLTFKNHNIPSLSSTGKNFEIQLDQH